MARRREKPRARTPRVCIHCGRLLIVQGSAAAGIGPACLHKAADPGRAPRARYRPPHPPNTVARRLRREEFVRRYDRDVGHLVDFCQSWGAGADKIQTFVEVVARPELDYKPSINWKTIFFTLSRDYRRIHKTTRP